jgi:hypothetical protein
MTPLFKKLNFKNQERILALNTPESFDSELRDISAYAIVDRKETASSKIEFAIIFVTTQKEIDNYIKRIFPSFHGDAVLWFCYPKGTSKKFKCDFNRDTGWQALGKYNLEGVRQVAIDEDWSALRFRKTEFIKILRRRETYAISQEGKNRTKKNTTR